MSKAARPDDTGRRPWHQDCRLREDVRMGSTGAAEFAADLQSVRTGKAPQVYADPAAFFARTYPTHNLRGLVRDVLLRLEGREGRPVLRLQVAYGGGKTHALLSLLHLAEHGRELASDPTVRQFLDFAGLQEAPAARVALLPFDQFDVEEGLTAYAPDGRSRRVRTPWGALAYQLGGDAGLARVARHEADYVSPAEPVLAELLGLPAAQGLATLVLVDEAVWYGSQAVHQDPRRLGVLRDFFQVLTQAATRQPRTALVATLVSSDVYAHDPTALSVLQALEAVFGRVTETAEPVVREDVAEILRRRLFEAVAPEAARRAATDAFFAALAGLPLRQAQTAQAAYDRMLASYPFHPDLIEVLYQKWSQLPGAGLQRTRGSLRLMALALRAAEGRDPGAWVGPGTLLGTGAAPSRALTELISHTAEREPWTPILTGELTRAAEVQATYPSLRAREVEQAVVAAFLHSQPAGQSAAPADLWVLLAHPGLDRAALEESLRQWRRRSWFLSEDESVWRLGTAPNLTALHQRAMERVAPSAVQAEVRSRIAAATDLAAADPGVEVHVQPEGPADIQSDTPVLRLLVLGPEHAVSPGSEPPPEVAAIWAEKGPGNPRTYANGMLGLAPDPARLAGLRERVLRVLGWKALQTADDFTGVASQAQRAQARTKAAEENADIPAAVVACYTAALALDASGRLRARALPAGGARPFDRLKALLQDGDRLIVAGIDPAELLPGSPLQLWSEGATAMPVAAFVSPFYQFPRLPPLLRPELVTESLRKGVAEGAFCLRLPRPDGTAEALWRTTSTDEQLARDAAEVVPLQHATLERLRPEWLQPGALRGLWTGDGPTVGAVLAFFDGARAPRLASAGALRAALAVAVREGLVALRTGGRTYLGEGLPDGPLPEGAVLVAAPEPLRADSLLPTALPGAWGGDDGVTDLASLARATETAQKRSVPWSLVVRAVQEALDRHLLGLEPGSGPFPCDPDAAQAVRVGLPVVTALAAGDLVGTTAQAAWKGGRATVAALAAALGAGQRRIPAEAVHTAVRAAVDQGLVEVAGGGRLPDEAGPATLSLVLQRRAQVAAVDGTLTARELQMLAAVWPELQKAAPHAKLECVATVTVRGELPVDTVQQLDALLARVRAGWRLSRGG